ncbi:MAG TPA: nucleotide exchange factor GrpE [Pyrinomonadaceae bacterium]
MNKSFVGDKKSEPNEGDPVRVTDRRRIHLDQGDAEKSSETGTVVSLKPTYVEELEAKTKAAEGRVAEVQLRFEQLRQQLQRETDETRQRLNRAAEERAQRDKADFIATLLPVMDNLSRAIQAVETTGSLDTLITGVRSTAASFENALANAGVEPIESLGQDFNPELHEAVDTVPVEDDRDGKIVTEYSRGFRIGDRLLRPARVQVGRAEEANRREAVQ